MALADITRRFAEPHLGAAPTVSLQWAGAFSPEATQTGTREGEGEGGVVDDDFRQDPGVGAGGLAVALGQVPHRGRGTCITTSSCQSATAPASSQFAEWGNIPRTGLFRRGGVLRGDVCLLGNHCGLDGSARGGPQVAAGAGTDQADT